MQKSTSAGGPVLPDDQGLWSVVDRGAQAHPERPLLGRTDLPGEAIHEISSGEFAEQARAVAAELLALGVAHGDRVAVMGRTGYHWVLLSVAALGVGAVIVPVYPTASQVQVRHVLTDSGAAWAFAETDEQVRQVSEAGAAELRRPAWRLGQVDDWVAAAAGSTDAAADADADADAGARRAALDEEFVQRSGKVRADDLAMIIYTSGTTGLPKGCMLTHRNMFASSAGTVEQTGELFRTAPQDGPRGAQDGAQDGTLAPAQATTALCLPLSHVFGQTILFACLYAGTRTVLLPGIPELLPAMTRIRPTFLALVPYALEKIRKRVRDLPSDDVSAAFGGRLTQVICGGASLDDTTAAFFASAGVTVLNCYGLTEAATAVTVNAPATNRRGTVGRPIPGTTVAIADDGEVLVQGANVSPGYWSAGERAVGRDATGPGEDRWLHTGDVGHLDPDGYLVITGRRKEILVTNSGKNVAPTPLEDRVRLHRLVSNCMVVGEARPFVSALITVDPAPLAVWAEANGVPLDGGQDWREHPRLLAELQLAVDDANSLVSRAESIRKFRVLDGDFTVERGHLTPSMKLRRAIIEREFTEAIAFLYQ
ncbi:MULTISPECIES: AMP-dependent synthetase/ligase [Frankia]|uniref:Acyl-CoA synthetase n=1 Tax=Frankia alni (strain DSM 45986 / CECT 9034 / ACN14a) TaxID=326424 RepID=Q0RKX1_FRAAA|nr:MULTISPECIES: AMP-dependent synthetase/ligase [Frankia]CAJ61834.1 putative acyl-CoA synthetase (long-chain-fatty-acid--CoA ligase) [Frankia alni ACN14a]